MVSTQVGKFALLRQIGLYPFMDGVSRLNVTTDSPISSHAHLSWYSQKGIQQGFIVRIILLALLFASGVYVEFRILWWFMWRRSVAEY